MIRKTVIILGVPMSNIPSELRYSDAHEWARLEADGTATIGLSDHAQMTLGDVVFLELPKVGNRVAAGDAVGIVESVKAASDIYSPVGGEIIAINEELTESPELVNEEPYGDAWIYKIRLTDQAEINNLLDAKAYAAAIAG